MASPPPPDHWDHALHRLLSDAVAQLAAGSASVTQAWSEQAGMWFVEVRPTRADAAPISAAFDGDDLLSITLADTWFEMFPVSDAGLARFGRIVAAVLAGRMVQAGRGGCCFARIDTADGPVRVGAVHAPIPWSLRRHRRFAAYWPVPDVGNRR
ncbi:MAG TPA: hypothetical protein VGX49_09705 [Jatrophihabitans sp.]|jgi:hypothetical protein|nr:hypothetical protein [Jatrophihabitans sp.]